MLGVGTTARQTHLAKAKTMRLLIRKYNNINGCKQEK